MSLMVGGCLMFSVRIRVTINVTSLSYSAELVDESSPEFATLARRIKDAVEAEYFTVAGQQTVNVLQFRSVRPAKIKTQTSPTSL